MSTTPDILLFDRTKNSVATFHKYSSSATQSSVCIQTDSYLKTSAYTSDQSSQLQTHNEFIMR